MLQAPVGRGRSWSSQARLSNLCLHQLDTHTGGVTWLSDWQFPHLKIRGNIWHIYLTLLISVSSTNWATRILKSELSLHFLRKENWACIIKLESWFCYFLVLNKLTQKLNLRPKGFWGMVQSSSLTYEWRNWGPEKWRALHKVMQQASDWALTLSQESGCLLSGISSYTILPWSRAM